METCVRDDVDRETSGSQGRASTGVRKHEPGAVAPKPGAVAKSSCANLVDPHAVSPVLHASITRAGGQAIGADNKYKIDWSRYAEGLSRHDTADKP